MIGSENGTEKVIETANVNGSKICFAIDPFLTSVDLIVCVGGGPESANVIGSEIDSGSALRMTFDFSASTNDSSLLLPHASTNPPQDEKSYHSFSTLSSYLSFLNSRIHRFHDVPYLLIRRLSSRAIPFSCHASNSSTTTTTTTTTIPLVAEMVCLRLSRYSAFI